MQREERNRGSARSGRGVLLALAQQRPGRLQATTGAGSCRPRSQMAPSSFHTCIWSLGLCPFAAVRAAYQRALWHCDRCDNKTPLQNDTCTLFGHRLRSFPSWEWSERRRHAGALNCKALPASSMDRCLCVQDSMHVHSRMRHDACMLCVGAGSTVLCGPQSHRPCTPARPAHAALIVCGPKRGPKQVRHGAGGDISRLQWVIQQHQQRFCVW